MSTTSLPVSDQLFFNGIDGSTGSYLLPPLSVAELAEFVRGDKYDPKVLRSLKTKGDAVESGLELEYALRPDFDPTDLSQAGWGIILPAVANASRPDPRLEALRELLNWRREQSSRINPIFYQEFTGPRGFRPGDTAESFMQRLRVDYTQMVDPELGVPYYLLLVASPEEIPYSVQYQLDIQFAVGRIYFDNLEEYAQYARSVVLAERREVRVARSAVFFGVQNHDDPATQLSANNLVAPLAEKLKNRRHQETEPAWQINSVLAEQATKANLAQLLGGPQTPSLLFTASHGMGFPKNDPRQLQHQGALLCQDWPGPREWRQPIDPAHYFSADDIDENASLAGMIAFHFACYGAGTPELDEFAHSPTRGQPAIRAKIAPHPFVAALPRRLLGHSRGGALAVIGHVERAWGYSFQSPQVGTQLQTFEATLTVLMQGKPVGLATDSFNGRYAALAVKLTKDLEDLEFGAPISAQQLASLWTSHNDARSYIVLGDPAVRLPLVNANETPTRAIGSARSSFSPTSPAAPNFLGHGLGSITAASPTPPTRNNPTQNFSNAGPSDQSAGFRGDSDKSALETSNSFLQQIEQTSKRFAEAQSQEVSFEVADGDRTKARIKDADRLSWRLRQLGIPDEQIASTSQESFSFQPITNTQELETSTADLLLERILGRNDMVAAPRFLEAGLRASRAVARIRIRSASGTTLGWGTGSLIAPRLLLTNNHVLESASDARHSLAEFNVEEQLPGQTLPLVAFALRPDEFFLTDEFLDFTLVAVAPQSTNGQSIDEFGYNPPFEGDDPILESEKVNIIQHPSGRPKELALRDNTVTAILADFIHYEADTEPGSSGSPVFNDQWQLVALHHSGVPKRDGQGRIVMRDGRPWQKGLSDQLIDWVANEGVRLSRILAKVQAAPLTTSAAKALRDQLRPFNSSEAVATNPIRLVSASNQATDNHRSAPSSQSPPAATSVVTPSPMAVATTGPDGVLKIVVPVEITISLDASGIAPRANPPSDSIAQGASQTLRDPTS